MARVSCLQKDYAAPSTNVSQLELKLQMELQLKPQPTPTGTVAGVLIKQFVEFRVNCEKTTRTCSANSATDDTAQEQAKGQEGSDGKEEKGVGELQPKVTRRGRVLHFD